MSLQGQWQVRFVVIKRCTSAYCTKLREKQCSYLLIMYMENITENQGKCKFLQRTCAICNLHSCYNFVLMLHEIAFVFSHSEVHNFFMYSRVKKLFLKSKFIMLISQVTMTILTSTVKMQMVYSLCVLKIQCF